MGVTIHYRFGQKRKFAKQTLDIAQVVAEKLQEEARRLKVEFEIVRHGVKNLLINIGGCESLVFDFKSINTIKKENEAGYSYEYSTLLSRENGLAKLDMDLLYAFAFCKTQYASNIIEHKWVADIIKVVASRCLLTEVYDEGGYYHSGILDDAIDSISENAKMIDGIAGMLGGLGYKEENITRGGITKIKKEKV